MGLILQRRGRGIGKIVRDLEALEKNVMGVEGLSLSLMLVQ